MKKIGMFALTASLLTGGMVMLRPSQAEACGGYGDMVQNRASEMEQSVRQSLQRQGRVLMNLREIRRESAADGQASLVFVRVRFRTQAGTFTQRLALREDLSWGGPQSRWTVVPVLRGPVRAARVG